jgi:hypothetical protein
VRALLVPIPLVVLGVAVLVLNRNQPPEARKFAYARGALWILLGLAFGVLIEVPIAGGFPVLVTFALWGTTIARARRAGA